MSLSAGRFLRLAAACAAVFLLAGCGLFSSKEDEYVERPPEELYNTGLAYMQDQDYNKAAKAFDEVDRQHPYSPWATQAQLMSAYANYLQDKYDDALISLGRFIDLHPGNKGAAYAYYLKAICYYEQIVDVGRDQKNTQLAFDALNDVVTRFPNTDYARDAALKLDLARDHLAGKEMEVGRYYLKRGNYLAAINRFRKVVDDYQVTSHLPEALHRLVEAYTALGLTEEARKAAAVLGHNYPGSEWYVDSYSLATGNDARDPSEKKKPGFFGRLF